MRHVLNALFRSSLIRFGLTGVLNTAVGIGTIFALKWFFDWADTPANFCGYALGVMVSYYVNSRWTFQYRAALHAKVLPYALVLSCAYLVNLGCVHFFIQILKVNSYLAQVTGVIPYSLLTYVLLRRYVFVSAQESNVPV
ncbi:MAG: GtrA family protein [Steroidobacteraceae bacterium]